MVREIGIPAIQKTDDLLLNVGLAPATTGYTSQLRNVGELENKGFEFVINTQNTVGVFRWSSSFTYLPSTKNEVTNLRWVQVIDRRVT
ncbi:MAG: hypothetical protein U5K71_12960 [Gracilimonas sp.]|nr:hypothetical protein [Gracilimonas sp.]